MRKTQMKAKGYAEGIWTTTSLSACFLNVSILLSKGIIQLLVSIGNSTATSELYR